VNAEQPEPQPNSADLIDSLADYCTMRGAAETKAEMVEKLTAMSEEQLHLFADLTLADVAKATGQKPAKSKIALPRRYGR
jgi:hypothetical protein